MSQLPSSQPASYQPASYISIPSLPLSDSALDTSSGPSTPVLSRCPTPSHSLSQQNALQLDLSPTQPRPTPAPSIHVHFRPRVRVGASMGAPSGATSVSSSFSAPLREDTGRSAAAGGWWRTPNTSSTGRTDETEPLLPPPPSKAKRGRRGSAGRSNLYQNGYVSQATQNGNGSRNGNGGVVRQQYQPYPVHPVLVCLAWLCCCEMPEDQSNSTQSP